MASMCPPVSPGKDLMGIGKHCNVKDCHKLDFLPYRCELCKLVFCETHRLLETHNCTEKYTKDNIVPRCPICSLLVPAKQGQTLDQAMNEHINGGCKKVTQKGKTYVLLEKASAVPLSSAASCGIYACAHNSLRFMQVHEQVQSSEMQKA
jgi:predicted nucleic acid binding AN1-type Zn finger protein